MSVFKALKYHFKVKPFWTSKFAKVAFASQKTVLLKHHSHGIVSEVTWSYQMLAADLIPNIHLVSKNWIELQSLSAAFPKSRYNNQSDFLDSPFWSRQPRSKSDVSCRGMNSLHWLGRGWHLVFLSNGLENVSFHTLKLEFHNKPQTADQHDSKSIQWHSSGNVIKDTKCLPFGKSKRWECKGYNIQHTKNRLLESKIPRPLQSDLATNTLVAILLERPKDLPTNQQWINPTRHENENNTVVSSMSAVKIWHFSPFTFWD